MIDKQLDFTSIPTNIDIEKKVLNILLMNPGVHKTCTPIHLSYFYFPEHKLIYETLLKSIEDNKPIDIVILSHILKGKLKEPIENFILIEANKDMLNEYIDILSLLDSNRKILALSQRLTEEITTVKDVDIFINSAIDELKSMLKINNRKDIISFDDALENTVKEIGELENGKKAFYMTQWDKFNTIVSLPKNNILLISGDKQSAKSNFVIALEQTLLENNSDIMFLHFTMEEPKEKVIRRLFSSKVGLSDNKIRCINYTHTKDDIDNLIIARDFFRSSNYDINFIERKITLKDFKMYVYKSYEIAKEKKKELIVIVDNLGLIDEPSIKDDIAKENIIAGELITLRDDTKALFIIVHHLVKSNINKYAIIDGYRPREEYIRGSSRIPDYANQVILVNKPKKYSDLMELYERRCIYIPENLDTMSLEEIFELLWNINSQDDFYSKSFSDLKVATLNEMRNQCINKYVEGMPLTPQYIYYKYLEYSNYFNSLNDGKDDKYKKQDKQSIWTYLSKGSYLKTYKQNKSIRDEYLFGKYYSNNEENCKFLENVFIMEITKNKNFDSSDDNIIRFNANLDSNIFVEL